MSPNDAPCLLAEVELFRYWAAPYTSEELNGELECSYEGWPLLYTAFLDFVDRLPFTCWSPDELSAILYILARDNEMQYLSRELRDRNPQLFLDVAEACVRVGESDAKWQVAVELGQVATDLATCERLLLTLVRDDNEYVRRRSLGSLAEIGSPATEQLALEAWSRPDDSQEFARAMSLHVLRRITSPHLERLLAEAERDECYPFLSAHAAKGRRGEVDW